MRKLFSRLTSKTNGKGKGPASTSSSEGATVTDSSTVYTYDVKEKDLPRLHQAAWTGNQSKAKQLAKDDINQADNCGRTPLHLACAKGHLEVVKVLLQRKASPNLTDEEGRTPLMKGVQCQNGLCVDFLLQYGCNTNVPDKNGCICLHYAAMNGSCVTAAALLDKGSDVNFQNKAGQTALFAACAQRQTAMCQMLLERGADVNIGDEQMQTPFTVACALGDPELVALLKTFGADPSAADNQGTEEYAVFRGNKSDRRLSKEQAPSTGSVTPVPAALHGSSNGNDASSVEMAAHGSRKSAVMVQDSPSMRSNRSRSNAGSIKGDVAFRAEDVTGRVKSAATKSHEGDDSDNQNSWCSSDEDRKQKAKEKLVKQSVKINLVKMLESYESEGKVTKAEVRPIPADESSGWSDSDSESTYKTPANVKQPKSIKPPINVPASGIGGTKEESSWDSDTESRKTVLARKKTHEVQQHVGEAQGNSLSVGEANVPNKASPEPSAPPMFNSDAEGGWDSDATSKQMSLKAEAKKSGASDRHSSGAKGSGSEWDSDEDSDASAKEPHAADAVGEVSGASGKPLDSSQASHPRGAPVKASDFPVEAVAILPKLSRQDPLGNNNYERPFTSDHAPPTDDKRLGCRCTELTIELRDTRDRLEAALVDSSSATKQLTDLQTANKELLDCSNETMKAKALLESRVHELDARCTTVTQQLTREEEGHAVTRAALTKLRQEFADRDQQHARELDSERRKSKQNLEASEAEVGALRAQMLQVVKEKQDRYASHIPELEENHLRLQQRNDELAAQLTEANAAIRTLKSNMVDLEQQSAVTNARVIALNDSLSAAKAEQQQLHGQNLEQQNRQAKKIADLQEQADDCIVKMKSREDALTQFKQLFEHQVNALQEEAKHGINRQNENQTMRNMLEDTVKAAQERLKNAENELWLSSEAQKTMEAQHQLTLSALHEQLSSKDAELQKLLAAYEEMHERHKDASSELRRMQEKVLAQSTALGEKSSALVQLRAAIQEQKQRSESLENEAISDKKRLASMQAELELLQDNLQRLQQRKLLTASKEVLEGRTSAGADPVISAKPQVASPSQFIQLKECLSKAEDEIASKELQLDEVREQLAEMIAEKEQLIQKVQNLETQLRSLESVLTVEKSTCEALRGSLKTLSEEHQQQRHISWTSSSPSPGAEVDGTRNLQMQQQGSETRGRLGQETTWQPMSPSTLELKLRKESQRCAQLMHQNIEMKTKLKLVKLYLNEMTVQQQQQDQHLSEGESRDSAQQDGNSRSVGQHLQHLSAGHGVPGAGAHHRGRHKQHKSSRLSKHALLLAHSRKYTFQ